MAENQIEDEPADELDVDHDCTIPHSEPIGGTGSLETALASEKNPVKRIFKLLGPGLVTGASDDDPSGIGTYTTGVTTLPTKCATISCTTSSFFQGSPYMLTRRMRRVKNTTKFLSMLTMASLRTRTNIHIRNRQRAES